MAFLYYLPFFVILLSSTHGESVDTSPCGQAKNCEQCMGISPECSWCFDSSFDDSLAENGPGFRCAPKKTLLERNCPDSMIQTVTSVQISDDFSKPENQLQPKSRNIKVRPHESFSANFTFQSRKNYPVDLYFLVDLSFTMKKHIETVSKMTNDIKNEMLGITNDLRLGFGAFVDKPIFPFSSPDRIKNPCYGDPGYNSDMQCDPTFLYRHMLSLTDKYSDFQEVTTNMIHSGNLDSPEGGFDALLQVAHCSEKIGWRKDARKIVVFATDGSFHLAGDGRLAGLVKPPPTTCQLSLKPLERDPSKSYWGWYTADQTDYPSLGEVARVLTDKSISVIFATVPELSYVYKSAASFLPSAGVGILANNAENIVELLRDNYQKIASKIDVTVTHNSALVDVKLLTKCADSVNFTESSFCDNHPVGAKIEYQVKVTPKACFEGTERVVVKLIGLEEDAVIELQSQCQCPLCDRYQPIENSPNCNKQGSLECGSCKCYSRYSGDFCRCSDQEDPARLINKCRETENSPICSRRGRCDCGKCICSKKRFQGEFCQCDLEMCPRASDNNKVCGGEERGTCNCDGRCDCKPGYKGPTCDCLESEAGCFDRSTPNATRCSGKGVCDCGSCFCEAGWTGRLCNEPQGDGSFTCHMEGVETCIPCLLEEHLKIEEKSKTKTVIEPNEEIGVHEEAKVKCEEKCKNTEFDYTNAVMVSPRAKDQNDGSNLCIHYTDSCKIYFLYRFSDVISQDRKVTLKLIREKECSDPRSIIYIVAAVVSAIVFGGLLFLLIYKLVIVIEDKKIMADFKKNNADSQYGITVNPTYKNPSTTVQNPMYRGANYN